MLWQYRYSSVQFSSFQLLRCVWLFATPWTAARQAFLSITSSQSLLKLISIESVMPSNHLILCRPLLLLPSIFPSIRVFSNEWILHIRWPKYWSFNFSISPSNDYSGGLVGSPCSPRESLVSSPTPQLKSINSSALRHCSHENISCVTACIERSKTGNTNPWTGVKIILG